MKIEIKYNIKDRVNIIPLRCKGRVMSIWITDKGIRYEVRYFDEAKVKEVYFYAEELEYLKGDKRWTNQMRDYLKI